MEMFKNYPQSEDYSPDNRRKCFPKNKITIMAGETTKHSFEIPFNVETDTIDCDVIYKLGLNVVLTKDINDCTFTYDEKDNHKTILNCTLSSEDTMLFANTLLDAHVQIRFIMNDFSVMYTEIYPVKLIDSLDVAKEE